VTEILEFKWEKGSSLLKTLHEYEDGNTWHKLSWQWLQVVWHLML